jgi:hypothetical protein
MSRTHSLDRFQTATLSRLRSVLPFRSAYWGMLHAQPGGPLTLHSSYVDALPNEFVRDWEAVKHKDELAASVVAAPGVAASVRTVDMNHREILIMGRRFGIGSATSIAVAAPVPKLLTFLSFYRPADAPPFDHDDRCVQEFIMPHVAAAWHANWLHHFEGMHACGLGRAGQGLCRDRQIWRAACQRRHVFRLDAQRVARLERIGAAPRVTRFH